MKIRDIEVLDLRFPTSRTADGTDAMHPDPDYSAAYVVLKTDGDVDGHGFTFTIGRGNEVCVEAIRAFRPLVVGRTLEDLTAHPAAFWRELSSESQLRWLGPEKGVIHISMAAIVNAVWDLHAKRERKPVWKLLADMTPKQIVSVHRLPLPHRRADALPRRSTSSNGRRKGRPSARRGCCAKVIPPTRLPPDGSDTPTTRSVISAARPSPTAGRISRSRSARRAG
jgi:L-alanine-DL-glutamate epimerase-like enolase superfamily enzyme